tara:strand:+ start:169 stop:708 length:540 start_codon:yes stop_codon:yes gene_type:complete
MANKKITELTALTSPASDDVLAIVDVSGTAETKKITVANLTAGGGGDDHFLFNGGGFVSSTSEMAVSFGLSTTDSTVFNYITTALIPIACRVVSVTTQSQSNAGSTDISVYKPTAYNESVSSITALGTVNHAAHNLGTVYTSTFDSATYDFAAGDRLGVTIDGTTNPNGLSLTVLLKKI